MTFSVVLDTCVLYPAYLRDTLLRLAEAGLFRPLWSAGILDELDRNLVEAGIPAQTVQRLVTEMRTAFDDAEVVSYEPLIATMTCDHKDRHVLAAAVCAGADTLVTSTSRTSRPPRASRTTSSCSRRTPSCSGYWTWHPG
jgi:predicted nucleic acid-binding protein